MANTHYHVTGYWADDTGDNYRPLTLEEANDDMAQRARLFEEYHAETAMIRHDEADSLMTRGYGLDSYPVGDVPRAYKDAADSYRACETYHALALNNERFDKFPLADNEQSRRFSLGIDPGANGRYYVNTGDLAAYECRDSQCERDWAEYEAMEGLV